MEKVKGTIQELEDQYSVLLSDIEDEMEGKEESDKRFLKRFRNRILTMPVSRKSTHVKFFRDSEDDILAAKNTTKILAILSRYVDYRNCEILCEVTKFCSPPLQANMQDYRHKLEVFEKATSVNTYTNAISAGKSLKVAFSKMVLKINKSEFECTLYDIRKLKEEIAEAASLHSHSVYIESEGVHCVEVVVGFPSTAVGWMLGAMTPDFMTRHQLTEVVVDGRQLTVVQGERQQLVGSLHITSISVLYQLFLCVTCINIIVTVCKYVCVYCIVLNILLMVLNGLLVYVVYRLQHPKKSMYLLMTPFPVGTSKLATPLL